MKTFLCRKLFLILSLTALAAIGAHAQITNSSYTGMDLGNWGEAGNWSPAAVPNNSGMMSYNVSITDHAVTLDIDPTITALSFGGDSASITSVDHSLISSATSVTPAGGLDFTAETTNVLMDAGTLADFSGTTLTGGFYRLSSVPGKTATLRFNGADIQINSAVLYLIGAGSHIVNQSNTDALSHLQLNTVDAFLDLEKGQNITTLASLVNDGYIYSDRSTVTVNGDLTSVGDRRDAGTVGILDGLGRDGVDSRFIVNGVMTNYDAATHTLTKGRYFFAAAGGTQHTVQVLGGAPLDIMTLDSAVILQGPNTGFLDLNGNDALRHLSEIDRVLIVGSRSFTTAGNLKNNDTLYVYGDSNFTVSGNLTSGGLLDLSVINGYSTLIDVAPGLPVDPSALSTELNVQGILTLAPENNLTFEVFGPSAPGVIKATGAATFDGTLSLTVLDGATIANSDSLTVLTAASISGEFSNAPSGRRVVAQKYSDFTPGGSFRVNYSGHDLVLSEYLPHAGLLNIATRAKVQTGDNVTIAGFIIGGFDAKQIIVRGIGPSLTTKGVPGALADPSVELFDDTGASIAVNDNWQDTQATEIQAAGLAPTDSHESAILATLNPGNYTAVLHGVNNGVGVGLVEVYDIDQQPSLGELTNISTRARVETGDNVLIGGIIIQEGEAGHLIVRAMGPSLANQHVAGALADPTLDLYDASGAKIMSNDNWNDDAAQSAQLQKEGLAPTDTHESALSVALNPGNYTAIVRGKGDTTGVGLVEFYKLN
jgi:hypothetical protein